MPDEKDLFQTTGPPWSERARRDELDAVLTASGNHARNTFLHHTHAFVADQARRSLPSRAKVVDFGCGTGRFLRFFAAHGHSVLGTEITPEMLERTKELGLPDHCSVALTDGVRIPVESGSIDMVWACAVLRYSLNVANPVYDQIACEMYRVLKPGGLVVNCEMYVAQPASDFVRDFEAASFRTEMVRVINRQGGRVEDLVESGRFPLPLVAAAARLTARYHFHFDPPDAPKKGLRDYMLVWRKPR